MFELTLGTGTRITIERLVCRRTQASHTEGAPTRALNERFLEHLMDEAREGAAMPVRAFLPQPKDGVALPAVACIADLESKTANAQGEGRDGSWLRIVWLQHDAGDLPLPPRAVLAELDWQRDARNFDY